MAQRLTVLLLGRSRNRINVLEDMLLGASDLTATRQLVSGDAEPTLEGLPNPPDVLLVDLGDGDRGLLKSLSSSKSASSRPPMVVIGPEGDMETMRHAMQAGARDFHTDSVADEELVASLRRVALDARLSQKQKHGNLTVVINGKGGSGASFIASSLATASSVSKIHRDSSTAVLDFDFQFGELPVYFDMPADEGLIQALDRAADLDPIALDGLMRTHSSGARLLAGRVERIDRGWNVGASSVSSLLNLLCRVHDHVVVDVPRHIDERIIAALEQADDVVVVTQQTVPHVRDTSFLVGLLGDIGLSNESIRILVNRYERRSPIRMDDLRDVFDEHTIHTVPNDYKRVSFAVDNGVPLLTKYPRSPVGKSIIKLADMMWPAPETADGNMRGAARLTRQR